MSGYNYRYGVCPDCGSLMSVNSAGFMECPNKVAGSCKSDVAIPPDLLENAMLRHHVFMLKEIIFCLLRYCPADVLEDPAVDKFVRERGCGSNGAYECAHAYSWDCLDCPLGHVQ